MRELTKLVDDVLPREVVGGKCCSFAIAEMHVCIDKRWHHRLAREVDVRRVGGCAQIALTSDSGELAVSNDERGVVDRRPTAAVNQSGAFVDDGTGLSATLKGSRYEYGHQYGHEYVGRPF